MKTLRVVAFLLLVNTAILWCIVCMNLDSTINYPSKGLVVWAMINGFAVVITQVISLCESVDNDNG